MHEWTQHFRWHKQTPFSVVAQLPEMLVNEYNRIKNNLAIKIIQVEAGKAIVAVGVWLGMTWRELSKRIRRFKVGIASSVSLGIGNCGVDCGDRCAAGLAAPR